MSSSVTLCQDCLIKFVLYRFCKACTGHVRLVQVMSGLYRSCHACIGCQACIGYVRLA